MPISTPEKPVSVIQHLAARNQNIHLDAAVPNSQEWKLIKQTIDNYSTSTNMNDSVDQSSFEMFMLTLKNAALNYDANSLKQSLEQFETWVNCDVVKRGPASPVVNFESIGCDSWKRRPNPFNLLTGEGLTKSFGDTILEFSNVKL